MYEVVSDYELRQRGLKVERQVVVHIEYKGIRFNEGFRADIIFNRKVVIELKSVEKIDGSAQEAASNLSSSDGLQTGISFEFQPSVDEKRNCSRC